MKLLSKNRQSAGTYKTTVASEGHLQSNLSTSNDNTDLSHNDESLEVAIIDIRVFLLIIMAASCCNSIIKENIKQTAQHSTAKAAIGEKYGSKTSHGRASKNRALR